MKRILSITAIALLVLVVGLAVYKERVDARYFEEYDPNLPHEIEVHAVTEEDGYRLEYFSFQSRPGEMVPTLLALPKEQDEPLPLILFLHGIGQKKDFLKEICTPFVQNGFAFACFDQHMQGERKLPEDASVMANVRAFWDRPWKTVNDSRRFLDFVEHRDDIDMDRIYLVGASYGAITGSTFTARDKRVQAAALVYGGADINTMLQAEMIDEEIGSSAPALKPVLPVLRNAIAYLLDASDPKHYAAGIAPRPVLLQNGLADRVVSPEAGKILQEAVQGDKTIQWYEGDHIGLDEDTVKEVLLAGLTWLVKQDADHRDGDASLAEESLDFFTTGEEKTAAVAPEGA